MKKILVLFGFCLAMMACGGNSTKVVENVIDTTIIDSVSDTIIVDSLN